jgi:hypothetical protein
VFHLGVIRDDLGGRAARILRVGFSGGRIQPAYVDAALFARKRLAKTPFPREGR